jgi:hypothetical protein
MPFVARWPGKNRGRYFERTARLSDRHARHLCQPDGAEATGGGR